jgi:hypothetical protein
MLGMMFSEDAAVMISGYGKLTKEPVSKSINRFIENRDSELLMLRVARSKSAEVRELLRLFIEDGTVEILK